MIAGDTFLFHQRQQVDTLVCPTVEAGCYLGVPPMAAG